MSLHFALFRNCALALQLDLLQAYSISLHSLTQHTSYEGLAARIMSPSFITRLSMCIILAFSCTALQILEEGQSRDLEERTLPLLPAPTQGLAMILPANISTDPNDIDNRLNIRCDAAAGSELTATSCNNVLALSPTSDEFESWGYLDELPPGTTVDEDLPCKLWSGKESGSALMKLLCLWVFHLC